MSTNPQPDSTGPLQVTLLTPASCASVLWRRAGGLWATVIVKGTFRLVHGQAAEVAPPAAVVQEDRCRSTGTLAEACETAPYLPGAGVILSGHAFALGGQPVTSAAVRLGLAGDRRLLDKTLHVYGDCTAATLASAQPFLRMPLAYERAYGGPGTPENPAGIGPFGGATLPNVVDAVDPRRPGGFGPIARHWPSRRRLLGSVDSAVLAGSVPEVPEGLDGRYFHAAPADQQIEALQGSEWIVLDGMHPELPRVQSRLPDVRARAEWRAGEGPVQAVELRADTLVIDADGMLCSVVWRGRLQLDGLEVVPRVRVLAGIASGGETLSFSWEAAAPVRRQGNPLAATVGPALDGPAGPVLPFRLEAAPMAGLGGALAASPAPALAPRVGRAASALAATLDPDEAKVFRAALPFGGVARAPELRVPVVEVEPTPVVPVPVMVAPVVKAAEVVVPASAPVETAPKETDAGVRKLVLERLSTGRVLHGLDLVGADLHELDLSGALLLGLDLRRANLQGAQMAGANLVGANLQGSDLTDAVLTGADLTRANLSRAVLVRANLEGANETGARFAGADLRDARRTETGSKKDGQKAGSA